MSLTEVVIEGTLGPDGTLQLDEKPNLPAGRVQVIVQVLPELPDGDPFWDMMNSIWAGQRKRAHVARSAEEVEAERRESVGFRILLRHVSDPHLVFPLSRARLRNSDFSGQK